MSWTQFLFLCKFVPVDQKSNQSEIEICNLTSFNRMKPSCCLKIAQGQKNKCKSWSLQKRSWHRYVIRSVRFVLQSQRWPWPQLLDDRVRCTNLGMESSPTGWARGRAWQSCARHIYKQEVVRAFPKDYWLKDKIFSVLGIRRIEMAYWFRCLNSDLCLWCVETRNVASLHGWEKRC